jgi:Ca2+-binding RTX toxin-like protein
MAYYAYNSNVVAGGIRHVLGADDTVSIGLNGYLGSSDAQALSASGVTTAARVLVQGTLVGATYACDFVHPVGVMATAQIVVAAGGLIDGGDTGIIYEGIGLALMNSGTVTGARHALHLISDIGEANRIHNSGLMAGDDYNGAIYVRGIGRVEITNTGTIATTGNVYAISLDIRAGNDVYAVIVNSGTITGRVLLGIGADRFDNREGTVSGEVYLWDGPDTFLPGLGEETVSGGLGRDTLDFRGEGAVVVALDGSLEGTGRAAGDTYAEFEEVLGSVRADVLVGDGAANFLFGRGGADTLSGGAGSDTLRGGIGGDRLTGGQGNDAFGYGTVFEGGDVIVDFGRVTGNDDRFLISALLGGGLAVGALPGTAFAAVADLGAIAGDDRLIFRTTDTTVWFDADGAGGAAAVLLADLQAGAVVTAADFTVY